MQQAKIQAGIESWWGQGTATDGRMPLLLSNAGTFRWTIYYEPEGQGDPTSTQIGNGLAYLETHYTSNPAWLHVAGKPVIFVYADPNDACPMVDRWNAAPHRSDFYLVLKVFSGYRTCVSQPDSWHQYSPASAEDHQSGYSFSISPGFWKYGEASPRLSRDPNRWATNVADMVASKEPWELITTFNEWIEGTAIEEATAWASTYLDILAGSSPPSPSPTAFVTPTPSPTTTPTAVPSPSPTLTPSPSPGSSISHVVIVWLENHEYGSVTGTSMPYLTGLAAQYGLATNFDAVTHPSLPNYLAVWSGSTQGVTDDADYNLSAASLSTQMQSAGLSWRAFEQNYPATAGCHTASTYSSSTVDGWGVAGTYARKHDPPMSFTSVGGANCADILPLAAYSGAANLIFVTPNLCNDAHDCSLTSADNFLKAFLPNVLADPNWPHTLLIVSFDEGTTNTGGGGHVYTMLARQGMASMVSSTPHTHYGVTRTVENLFGLPCLANACSAVPLTEFLP